MKHLGDRVAAQIVQVDPFQGLEVTAEDVLRHGSI
jgi:hypothetical protein